MERRLGHGDAAHLGDLDPSRPGQEYVKTSESASRPGLYMVDARTGRVLWQTGTGSGSDGEGPGRGVAGDGMPTPPRPDVYLR